MRNTSLIGGMIIGVAVLAGVVSYAGFAGGSEEPETPAASTDTTTTTIVAGPRNPVYVDPAEVVVGPSVIVVGDVTVNNRQVSVNYDLHQLPPVEGLPAGAAFVPFQGFVEVDPATAEIVFPASWTAMIDGTEVPGAVANPGARAARFNVPDGVTASRVEAAWIDSYHLRIPLNVPFELTTPGSEIEVVPGISVSLLQISEQSGTTIVRVEVTVDNPINLSGLDVAGSGPGVVSSNREAEGGPRWNITFEGDVREAWTFTLEGSLWLEIEERIDVPLERADG